MGLGSSLRVQDSGVSSFGLGLGIRVLGFRVCSRLGVLELKASALLGFGLGLGGVGLRFRGFGF